MPISHAPLRGREAPTAHIASVHFRQFKALRDFSLTLSPMNVLVGPNNSGKSTIIGAFRAFAVAVQRAQHRRPERIRALEPFYRIPPDGIPISLENAATDYADVDAQVRFELTNGNRLVLTFPRDGGCLMTPEIDGPPVKDIGDFRAAYPISIAHIPVLGPVESDEPLVQEATVRRHLSTHRASRQFRSYWWYERDRFGEFRDLLANSWPGVDIKAPEIVPGGAETRLAMWCEEERIPRELYWAGSGFQVWCQLLTHLGRSGDATLLVVDEPEIYLHPDLQRQFLNMLRGFGPDVLLATHSSEIIAEADPHELVVVDKRAKSGKRVTGVEGVRNALEAVGSIHNVTFTQIARTKRVVLVEGGDFKLLARFARRVGLDGLAAAREFAVAATNGFPSPAAAAAFTSGMQSAVGARLAFAGVFDRDYRSPAQVANATNELRSVLGYAIVLGRKELENYLLVPDALQRAAAAAVRARTLRTGTDAPVPEIRSLLTEITDSMADQVLDRIVAGHMEDPGNSRWSPVTKSQRAHREFRDAWKTLDGRLAIVPGKALLSQLNARLQTDHQIALTAHAIVESFRVTEVAHDLKRILHDLDSFRRRAVVADTGDH